MSVILIDHMKHKVKFKLYQEYFSVNIKIFNSMFQWIENDYVVFVDFNSESIGRNTLTIKDYLFANNSLQNTAINSFLNKTCTNQSIWLQNCEF